MAPEERHMAKRTKRVRKKPVSAAGQTATSVAAPGLSHPEPVVEETPAGKFLSTGDQFRQEYAYVTRDLRHVFVIALAMFALLIALNLILQA
jgi:hypothetical protein